MREAKEVKEQFSSEINWPRHWWKIKECAGIVMGQAVKQEL